MSIAKADTHAVSGLVTTEPTPSQQGQDVTVLRDALPGATSHYQFREWETFDYLADFSGLLKQAVEAVFHRPPASLDSYRLSDLKWYVLALGQKR